MAWRKFKRLRHCEDEPLITITKDRFTYNTHLVRVTQLEKNKFVSYHIDDENRKIAFEFLDKPSDDSYPVGDIRKKGYRSSAGDITQKISWLKKIAFFENIDYRRFRAIKEKNFG